MDPLELISIDVGAKHTRVHFLVYKNDHYVVYISQEFGILLKYLGGLHYHLRRNVILLKPTMVY